MTNVMKTVDCRMDRFSFEKLEAKHVKESSISA